jgi:hypothetical protein
MQPATDRCDRKRRAGAALPRHLVAVEAGDHGSRFARNIDQHRGRRAAILRAVINACEHDQRADRRQAERDWQKHGDCRNGADARQYANERTDQRTKQAEADVVWVRGNRETHREIGKKFTHGGSSCSNPGPQLERQLQQINK